jgi:hypothetical protein
MHYNSIVSISSKVLVNLRLLLRKLFISPLRMLTRSRNASNKVNENREANLKLLPIEILVLQQYISVKDISHLDIAICDVDFRSLFLDSLQSVKIRDDNILGRGDDDFVAWVIKRQIKLLNLKAHSGNFTRMSVVKMAAGEMKLDTIEEFQRNSSPRGKSPITSAALRKIVTYCPMLKLLDLDSSFKDVAIIRVAECCPMIQHLCLTRCTILTDIAIVKIAECCPVLKSLELNSSSITDIAIIRIAECCPKLEGLHLQRPAITDIAIVRIAECCPRLETLDLQCPNITDIAVVRIAECCPRLENLGLLCPAITDIAVVRIAECCPRVERLLLCCRAITDIAVVRIAECCRRLEVLHLQCPVITNIAIIRVAECCPRLEHLSLLCPAITDIAVVRIAECCPRLKDFFSCSPTITDNAILRMVKSCPMLQSVHFMNCPGITDVVRTTMRESYPTIRLTID